LKGDTFFSSLAEQLEPPTIEQPEMIVYKSKEQKELGFDQNSTTGYLPSYQFAKMPMKLARHGGGFAVHNQEEIMRNKILHL